MGRRTAILASLVVLLAPLASCNMPGSPVGLLEGVTVSTTGVRIVGWGIDPDRPDRSLTVRIYVDGEPHLDIAADRTRRDLDTGVAGAGTAHGFETLVSLGNSGSRDVCAFGVNVGLGGPMTLFGCATVRLGSADPLGAVERTTLDGNRLTFVGWALDPDVASAISVEMTVNDGQAQTITADLARPELALFFADVGTRHGFSITVADDGALVAPTYCFRAIDHADPTRKSPLGCRTRPVDLTRVAGITVAKAIAPDVAAMVFTAGTQGIALSGDGYRSSESQIALRREHCGTSLYAIWEAPSNSCNPPTARPGRSLHERGLAIDFRCAGGALNSRSSPCFVWLAANAATYGFYNLPSEPWHWSVNGN